MKCPVMTLVTGILAMSIGLPGILVVQPGG